MKLRKEIPRVERLHVDTCVARCGHMYTCLSILLAIFNYRARGTCGPNTLNYPLNGEANA